MGQPTHVHKIRGQRLVCAQNFGRSSTHIANLLGRTWTLSDEVVTDDLPSKAAHTSAAATASKVAIKNGITRKEHTAKRDRNKRIRPRTSDPQAHKAGNAHAI
eukprot:4710694-Amphidinium_carterae.1